MEKQKVWRATAERRLLACYEHMDYQSSRRACWTASFLQRFIPSFSSHCTLSFGTRVRDSFFPESSWKFGSWKFDVPLLEQKVSISFHNWALAQLLDAHGHPNIIIRVPHMLREILGKRSRKFRVWCSFLFRSSLCIRKMWEFSYMPPKLWMNTWT